MLIYSHCERPSGAWQSHHIKARLLPHFVPRNDTSIKAFVLVCFSVQVFWLPLRRLLFLLHLSRTL